MITYPTGRLLGVLDRPEAAWEAADAVTGASIDPAGVTVLAGDEGLDRLGRLGSPPNVLSRFIRLFQFLLMDQLPDFLVYERAIQDGRAVVAIHVRDRAEMLRAAAALEGSGAHFLNYFGRFATEEVSLWRGPEPEIPGPLRR
jgi:hypothetical protein